MIKHTPSSGYWYSIPRVSLGTSMVALLCIMPVYSASWYQSIQRLINQLLQLTLVFLGWASVPAALPAHSQPATAVVAKVAQPALSKTVGSISDPNMMILRRDPAFRRYTYLFEGKATYRNQPCANASVLVRLLSGEKTVAKGSVTEADGSYSIEVVIDAAPDAPVDWTMEAYTPDFNKVEMKGRRIVQREEESKPVIVTNAVDFLASLPH
jgi:hypothetical protein